MTGFELTAWLAEEFNVRGVTDGSTRHRLLKHAADAFYVDRRLAEEIRAELERSFEAMGFPRAEVLEEEVPPPPVAETLPPPDDSDIPF